MTEQISELQAMMTPEARARAAAKTQAMLDEMPLNALRQARGLSQQALALILKVRQPSIAKMETRADMARGAACPALAAVT